MAENGPLSSRLESMASEICRRKLDSKCEALLILSKELDQCRSERDQFKLMAEQLRDRYQIAKRQLTGDTPMLPSVVGVDSKTYSDIQTQSLARLLFDTKENNKTLNFEVDDLKQKLLDAEGDIKLLREQIARSRVGTTDEGMNTRHFPAHEREHLVKQLEASREEYVQLERDLQQVLDEKEELVTERDAYRTKHERLNTELNYILRGDEKRIVDIDALSMENKFLQERLKQMEEEKTMAIATVTKYKSILERKKTKGMMKLGQSRSGGLVITQKQVQEIMQSRSSITPTPQALADLQGLCGALLDTINDKNLALSHQRKTNKLLGSRVNELEKKLKTLEVSGLWSVSGSNLPNLDKLKAECEEIKTLVPRQYSQSTDISEQPRDISDLDSELSSSLPNSTVNSPAHQRHTVHELSRLDLEELDLLPTKEEVVRGNAELGDGANITAVNAATSFTGTPLLIDSSVGVSGTKEQPSPNLLTEDTFSLRSLLGVEDQSPQLNWNRASSQAKWPISDEDSPEIGAQRYLIKSDDDDDDDDDVDGDDDDDGVDSAAWLKDNASSHGDEDIDAEMIMEECDEFKNLMDCVTAKLLQRSHTVHKGPQGAKTLADQDQALTQPVDQTALESSNDPKTVVLNTSPSPEGEEKIMITQSACVSSVNSTKCGMNVNLACNNCENDTSSELPLLTDECDSKQEEGSPVVDC